MKSAIAMAYMRHVFKVGGGDRTSFLGLDGSNGKELGEQTIGKLYGAQWQGFRFWENMNWTGYRSDSMKKDGCCSFELSSLLCLSLKK